MADATRRARDGRDGGRVAGADGTGRAPDLSALHPDWRAAWGGTVGGKELRAAMEANPRLHERMLASIAERHDLSVARAPRLDRTGAAVAAALREDAGGFVRLCGLARIGQRLALATNPDDYSALARTFGRDRLVAAARIASDISTDMPADDGGHGYDSEQLGPAVDRMGASVLRRWSETLPRASAEWIAMHMPREDEEPGGLLTAERARRIVEGAAERWAFLAKRDDKGDDGTGGGRSSGRSGERRSASARSRRAA